MNDGIMADVQRTLGRIEQKVDTALAWQQAHVQDDKTAFGMIREDIQGLKLTRAAQAGKAKVITAVLTAAAGTFGGLIATFFHRAH